MKDGSICHLDGALHLNTEKSMDLLHNNLQTIKNTSIAEFVARTSDEDKENSPARLFLDQPNLKQILDKGSFQITKNIDMTY